MHEQHPVADREKSLVWTDSGLCESSGLPTVQLVAELVNESDLFNTQLKVTSESYVLPSGETSQDHVWVIVTASPPVESSFFHDLAGPFWPTIRSVFTAERINPSLTEEERKEVAQEILEAEVRGANTAQIISEGIQNKQPWEAIREAIKRRPKT